MTGPQRHRQSRAIYLVTGTALFISPLQAAAFSPHQPVSRRYPRNLGLEAPFQRNVHVKDGHPSVSPLRIASKENDAESPQKAMQFFSSATFAVFLALSIQAFVAVSPSEASSYGQFSASVSPPKTAVSLAEQSGKTTVKTKGVATCQPVSAISSLNSNLSSKCKAPATPVDKDNVIDDEPMASQAIEHQQLLENLAKEPDWFNYVAAFSASVISTLIIHPLDTIKVRLMTDSKEEDNDEEGEDDTLYNAASSSTQQMPSSTVPIGSSTSPSYSTPRESSTALAAATSVYGNSIPAPVGGLQRILGDIPSLYSGILPNMVKEGPPSALYLGLYESSIVFLKQYPFFTDHKLIMYLLAGAIGELLGSVVRAPAEAVKTRVQTGYSVGEAMQTVFLDDDGRRNTFRAWSSSIFRDVPAGKLLLLLVLLPQLDIVLLHLLIIIISLRQPVNYSQVQYKSQSLRPSKYFSFPPHTSM